MYSKMVFSKGQLSLEQKSNDRTPFGVRQTVSPSHTIPRSHCHCPPEGQWSHKVGYFSAPHSGNPRRLCTLNYYLTHKRKRQSGRRPCRPLEKTPNVHVPSQGIASILNSSHQGQLQSGAKYNNSAWNCLWTQPVHWGKFHYIKPVSLGLKH